MAGPAYAEASTGLERRASNPLFVEVEPSTPLPLQHVKLHPGWEPAVRGFVRATETMPPVQRLPIDPDNPDMGKRWSVELDSVRDDGLYRELMGLAVALFMYELPSAGLSSDGAVILTRMLEHHTPDSFLYLHAWLGSALVSINGGDTGSAVVSPTGWIPAAGGDGRLPPHSDMWTAGYLFNVFGDAVPGQGETTLLRIGDALNIAIELGMPEEYRARAQAALSYVGQGDLFVEFNSAFVNDTEWSTRIIEALEEAALRYGFSRGEGYFVNDWDLWLHGRGPFDFEALTRERLDHRLYRLAFNPVTLERRRRRALGQPLELPKVESRLLSKFFWTD